MRVYAPKTFQGNRVLRLFEQISHHAMRTMHTVIQGIRTGAEPTVDC
jgi:hypothetical protein